MRAIPFGMAFFDRFQTEILGFELGRIPSKTELWYNLIKIFDNQRASVMSFDSSFYLGILYIRVFLEKPLINSFVIG